MPIPGGSPPALQGQRSAIAGVEKFIRFLNLSTPECD
jgi:hypothetical protein